MVCAVTKDNVKVPVYVNEAMNSSRSFRPIHLKFQKESTQTNIEEGARVEAAMDELRANLYFPPDFPHLEVNFIGFLTMIDGKVRIFHKSVLPTTAIFPIWSQFSKSKQKHSNLTRDQNWNNFESTIDIWNTWLWDLWTRFSTRWLRILRWLTVIRDLISWWLLCCIRSSWWNFGVVWPRFWWCSWISF